MLRLFYLVFVALLLTMHTARADVHVITFKPSPKSKAYTVTCEDMTLCSTTISLPVSSLKPAMPVTVGILPTAQEIELNFKAGNKQLYAAHADVNVADKYVYIPMDPDGNGEDGVTLYPSPYEDVPQYDNNSLLLKSRKDIIAEIQVTVAPPSPSSAK